MKRTKWKTLAIIAALMVGLVGTSGCSGDDTGGSGTPSAAPSAALTATPTATPEPAKEETAFEVTYSSAKTHTDSIGVDHLQVIVEFENTGSSDLYLSTSAYDIEDANGNLVANNSMASTYPDVISPGEKGYIYEEEMLDSPVDGELTVIPRISADKAKVENIRFNVTDAEVFTGSYGDLKAKGRVENTSNEESTMTYIVFILKNESGEPIGQMFTILMDTLASGEKVGFEAAALSLPDSVKEDTVSSFDVYAYPMQVQF